MTNKRNIPRDATKINIRHHILKGNDNKPQVTSSPSSNSYEPEDIWDAYGMLDITEEGTDQVIAIITAIADPSVISSSYSIFNSTYAFGTTNKLQIVNYNTSTTYDPTWTFEACLDSQWAHAIAPDAVILVVIANSTSNSDIYYAISQAINLSNNFNSNKPSVIAMSWGADEFSGETSLDSTFQSSISYIAAAGDASGLILYPSASPDIISVGGTSLVANSNGTFTETAWSSAGGGMSQYESLPSYQQSHGLSGKRNTCDVSFLADPDYGVAVYCSGMTSEYPQGWYTVGGTSVGVQCWAGIFAFVNQARLAAGKDILNSNGGTGDVHNMMYLSYSSDFNDITSPDPPAKVGYDNVTGLGSPTYDLYIALMNA